MRNAADILASVEDIDELREGHAAALERCEGALKEAELAQRRAQEAAEELRAWGEALGLLQQAARHMRIVESN